MVAPAAQTAAGAGSASAGVSARAAVSDRLDAHRDAVQMRHSGEVLEALGARRRELVHVGATRVVGELPAAAVTPAVRQRHGAGRHLVGHGDRRLDDSRRGGDAREGAVRKVGRGGVAGMDAQRVRAAAAHQQRRVVHPGVVRAQLAQADQAERELRRCAVGALEPVDLAERSRVADLHAAVGVAHTVAEHARPDVIAEHDAVR